MSLSSRSVAIKRKHEDEKKYPKKHAKSNSENNFYDNDFIEACEGVFIKVDEDVLNRYHFPSRIRNWAQNNPSSQGDICKMPPDAEELFNRHIRCHKWFEALQVCFLCITPTQYLSKHVLNNIVEIMLNAHEDWSSKHYNMTNLISMCQHALSLNLNMHPPCSFELWNQYKNLLTSPMDLRENTLTDRKKYGSEHGIIHYCIKRLLSELSADSKDDALFNKEDVIPKKIQHTIQEYHWVQTSLGIYEMLKRTDRIDRLMAVMESMTELLGFNLAFFQTSRGDRRIKLLMLELVSPFQTNRNVRDITFEIIEIFIYFVHLNYPEKYIKIMSSWINILAETLHENKTIVFSRTVDLYHPAPTCFSIADKFYKIMTDLPPETIFKVLESVTPPALKYSIAILHVRKLLGPEEGDIISILEYTLQNRLWNNFPEAQEKETPKCVTHDNILMQLAMISKNNNECCGTDKKNIYLKFETAGNYFVRDQNFIVTILFITFHAYLDNYKIPRLHKMLLLYKKCSNGTQLQNSKSQPIKKQSTSLKQYIEMNRRIYMGLQGYFRLLKRLKSNNELPEIFNVLEKVIDFNKLL